MEQQNKFQLKYHTKNNTKNQNQYQMTRHCQSIYQSNPYVFASSTCNHHFQSLQNSNKLQICVQSSQFQQPDQASIMFDGSFKQQACIFRGGNGSKCLQIIKLGLQKTVEINELTNFGDKSNMQSSENLIDVNEEHKIQLQNSQEHSADQKCQSNEVELNFEPGFDLPVSFDINEENVISLLECNRFNQLKFSKNYSNRKQLVAWKLKLKDILLNKYHLLQIPKIQKSFIPITKQKIQTKNKKQIKVRPNIRLLCIRKLRKIIKKNNLVSTNQEKYALQIIQKLQNSHPVSSLGFRKGLMKTFRQINQLLSEHYKTEKMQQNLNFCSQSRKYTQNLSQEQRKQYEY